MKNTILEKDHSIQLDPKPFAVKQALTAIELGTTDASVFEYLKAFNRMIPVEKCSFIHVMPDTSLLSSLFHKTGEASFDRFVLTTELSEELGGKINQYFEGDPNEKYHAVLEGDPLEQLINTAKEIEADLICIGQKSKNTYHSILAKNLARQTKGNALVIPDQAKASISHILVPIDFSSHSTRALRTAISINRRLEKPAKITCLHVYEMPTLSRLKINKPLADFEAMIRTDKAQALNFLLENVDSKDRQHIQTQLFQKDLPGIANYIMNAATDNGADLIIMGAKGHSYVDYMLMGSVTEKLMNINKTIATMIVK